MESKDTVRMEDSPVKINGIYLTEPKAAGHLKSHPLQLTYDGGFREIKEQEMFKEATSLPSHLRSGGSVFLLFVFFWRGQQCHLPVCFLTYVDDWFTFSLLHKANLKLAAHEKGRFLPTAEGS